MVKPVKLEEKRVGISNQKAKTESAGFLTKISDKKCSNAGICVLLSSFYAYLQDYPPENTKIRMPDLRAFKVYLE